MNNTQKILFVFAITFALLAGFWFGETSLNQQDDASSSATHVMWLEAPQKIAIPALQRAGGHFDMHDLEDKWSLLFFGYTNCPDICPATLNTLAQAKQAYLNQKAGQKADNKVAAPFPQVVFISVDPQRDNVEVLDEYVRYFDNDFIGVTGEEKLLRAITVQTYANYMSAPAEGSQSYLVSHSVNLAVINPHAELVAILSPPHTVESVLDVLQQLL